MEYKPLVLRTPAMSCLVLITLALIASVEYVNRKLPTTVSPTSYTPTINAIASGLPSSPRVAEDNAMLLGLLSSSYMDSLVESYATASSLSTSKCPTTVTSQTSVLNNCTEEVFACGQLCWKLYSIMVFLNTAGAITSYSMPSLEAFSSSCDTYQGCSLSSSTAPLQHGGMIGLSVYITDMQPALICMPTILWTTSDSTSQPIATTTSCGYYRGINSCGVVYPAVILLNTESQLTSVFIPSNDSPDTLCPVAEHLELYLNISVTLTSQTVPSTPASAVPTPTSSTAPLTSVANTSPTTVASSVPPDPTRRFTKLDWFLGSYLPVIIAVLYRMLWSYVYANVKLMQPFFQMNAPNGRGMQAKDLFCANYLASGAAYHPIQAMFHGDRLMLWASVSYTIAGLVGSLSSEVIAVDTKTGCSGGTGPNPCPPRLVTRLTIARLIEVMLGVTAVLAVYLTTLLHNSRSGVSSDPSSLATAASLLHHPQMLAGLRSVNCMGSKTDFANSLKNQRYRLTRYRTSTGQEYGVIPDEQQNSDLERSEKLAAKKTPTTDTPRQHSSRKRVLNIRDVVFGTFILGTLAFVIAYLKDSFYEDGFNKFMNSQSFGPKFIMASIGSLIDGHWKRIERETRVFQQYRDLAPGNAKSQGTLLQPTTSGPLTTLPYSLLHHHYFLTLISFTALLSEILIIVLAGVPYSSTQLYVAFLVSTYTSIAILGLMLLTLAVTMLWWRMGNPDIPRMPDTLGVVWSYLCWSDQMLSSFKDLSSLQQEERDKRVMGWRKRYIFGEAEMMEGVQRWVLDEDGPGE